MDIKKELSSNQIVLLSFNDINYYDKNSEILKQLSGEKVVYASFNKTCQAMEVALKKKEIDTTHFEYIDAITKVIYNIRGKGNSRCYYMDNPHNLNELLLLIDGRLRKGEEFYLVLDSVTNLVVYNTPGDTLGFLKRLSQIIKKTNSRGVYFALDSLATRNFIYKVMPIVDKTFKEN